MRNEYHAARKKDQVDTRLWIFEPIAADSTNDRTMPGYFFPPFDMSLLSS
jgi:hypothetical protein